jgi:shikimate dehydrogenase
MKVFGLIGRNIHYSFSKKYFSEKFLKKNIRNSIYKLFDIENMNKLKEFLRIKKRDLSGLNVTIPYKQNIIHFIDDISTDASNVGAVNTIEIMQKGYIGYNTDIFGLEFSLKKHIKYHHKKALILGTGGASKAAIFVLKKLGIDYRCVSRNEYSKSKRNFSFSKITKYVLKDFKIIINCTPVGTYPNINDCPKIPYLEISQKHYLYDMVYNPIESRFLREGRKMGCFTKNGFEMLQLQADKAWSLWNRKL